MQPHIVAPHSRKMRSRWGTFCEDISGNIFNSGRIKIHALFLLMPDPAVALDQWLRSHNYLLRKIIIPADLKWKIQDELDQANITKRALLPGLDGLSR
jgi:hypothetical protein